MNTKVDVIEETEVVSETTTNTNESFDPKDFTIIRDMIKEMDDWNKMLKDETHSILKNNYGLTNFAIFDIFHKECRLDQQMVQRLALHFCKRLFFFVLF